MKLPRYRSGPHTFQILTKRAARMRMTVGSSSFRKLVERAAYKWAHDRTDAGGLADAIENGDAWPLRNVWLGVSAEDQERANERIPPLLETPAAVRFVSAEPLLGSIDFCGLWIKAGPVGTPGAECMHCALPCSPDFCAGPRLHWVIAGAESGAGARPMEEDWVRSIREQCREAGAPFFYKQRLDERGRKVSLPLLDGRQWAEMPR